MDLENEISESTQIIQYADDICLYTTGTSEEKCQNILSREFGKLNRWFNENSLTISETKTEICIFTKKRVTSPERLNMGPYVLPVKSSVKYLGVTLDKKLLWKDHINQILKKTENALNILRTFCYTKWGADPNIAILFYNTLIRASLDYCCPLYGMAADTHLQKIESIKNKSLRVCLGYLNSTPINIMEVESGEAPLKLRRQLVSDKFIAKAKSRNSEYLDKVHELTICTLTHRYWNLKKTPLIVESYIKVSKYEEIIFKGNSLPQFKENYDIFSHPVKTQCLKIEGLLKHANAVFLEEIKTKWPSFEYIFTDGSKLENKTGCAFYHQNSTFFYKYKLPNEASIYTAELIAIIKALNYAITNGNKNYVIFTDSKSAVDKLTNVSKPTQLNHLEIEIIKTYDELIQNKQMVEVVWIKGHAGITGNEIVDKLAKAATISGEPLMKNVIPFTDLNKCFKENLRSDWQKHYSSSVAGQNFKCHHPNLLKVRWFSNERNKSFISTICRLRSNHALFPSHKYRIGLVDSPECFCGEHGDLQHILLDCPQYIQSIDVLYQELISQGLKFPINLNLLLFSPNNKILWSIYNHTIRCKMKL